MSTLVSMSTVMVLYLLLNHLSFKARGHRLDFISVIAGMLFVAVGAFIGM